MTDYELINRHSNGCQSSFKIFFKRYDNYIFRYVLGRVQSPEDALDIASNIWEKLVLNCKNISSCPKAYLWAITRNEVNQFFRKLKVTEDIYFNELAEPCNGADNAELTLLFKKLQKFSPEQRDAYLLQHYAGFTVQEIAEYQGVTKETAKSRIRYMTQKVKKMFRGNENE